MKTPALPVALMRRWGTMTLLLVGLVASLVACYPGTVDNITELDLVVTNYDTEFKFDGVRTYSMPDSIIDIAKTINPDADSRYSITKAQQVQIVGWIEAQMTARGYQRVPLPVDCEDSLDCTPSVDFFMLAGAVNTKTTVVGGGWGGCYPYWGYPGCWGYPWCCSYAYSYESGTVVINLLKPTGVVDEPLQVHWNGAIQNVISSSGESNMSRLESGIGQAFAQSPYLQASPAPVGMTMVKGELR